MHCPLLSDADCKCMPCQGPQLQLVAALQSRLAEGQQRALLVNYALLMLLIGRAEVCHKMVSAMADRWALSCDAQARILDLGKANLQMRI